MNSWQVDQENGKNICFNSRSHLHFNTFIVNAILIAFPMLFYFRLAVLKAVLKVENAAKKTHMWENVTVNEITNLSGRNRCSLS